MVAYGASGVPLPTTSDPETATWTSQKRNTGAFSASASLQVTPPSVLACTVLNTHGDTVPITFDPSAPLGSRNDAPRGACGVVTHVIVVDETNRACKTCVVPVVSS
jgi:hypothetical protein